MAEKIIKTETIAEKCGFDNEILKNFKENSLVFLLRNRSRIRFEEGDKELKIIFKGARLIRNYFKIIEDNGSSGYLWGGKLYLDLKLFENYISKLDDL